MRLIRSLLIGGLLAFAAIPAAQAVIDGIDGRMQRQQVQIGQLAVGIGTGTASSNAVTINAGSGIITTEALSTAAGATQAITLTNDRLAVGDVIFAMVDKGASAGQPVVANVVVTANTAVFTIQNIHASAALNAAVKIYFVLSKAGNAN